MTNIERMHKANARAQKTWAAQYAACSAWEKAKQKMTDAEWHEYCEERGYCTTHNFYDLG